MARIQLEVEVEGLAKVKEFGSTVASATSSAKKGLNDQKKAFQDNAKAITDVNKQVLQNKAALKEALSPIQALKREIKEYEAAALKAGEGTAAFAKNIQLAGQKKAELKDLKEAINALDPDRVAAGFLSLGRSIAGGFTLAQGASALLGSKNEALEQSLIRLQAAQATLAGLQELANAKDEIAKVKIIALQKLQTLETKRGIVATEGATVAQRLWNVAASGFPLAALIVGFTALAGLVAAYIHDSRVAADAERERSRAMDGTVIKSQELRDAYNEQLLVTKDLAIEHKVLTGEITELEGALAKLDNQYALSIANIKNETAAQLEETGSFWNLLKQNILGFGSAVGGAEKLAEQISKIQSTQAEKEKVEQTKIENERNKASQKNTEERIRIIRTLGLSELEAKIAMIKFDRDELLKNDQFTASERSKIQREAQNKIDELLDEQIKKRREKRLQLEKEYQDALLDIFKKAEAAQLETLAPKERLDKEKEIALASLAEQERLFIEKGKSLNRNFQLTKEQEEAFAQIRFAINQKYYEGIFQLQKSEAEKQKTESDKAFDASIKDLESRQEIQRNELIALQNAGGTTEERAEFERQRQQAILDVDIEFAEKKLALLEATGDAEQQEAISKLKATIAGLKKEQEGLAKDLDTGSFLGDILVKAFNISPEDAKAIVDNARLLAGELKNVISKAADESIAQNQRLIESLNTRISETQNALDQEIELNKRGFASNIENKKKEVEELQRQRDAAEKAQLAAQKRKQRIDDAEQISSMITAVANVIKGWSSIPLVGSILGLAAVATMIAGFVGAKSQARASAGFRKGGYTGDMGIDEEAGVVHGREFVHTAEKTQKHRRLFEAIHNDDYSKLSAIDLAPLLKGTGVAVNMEALKETTRRNTVAGSSGSFSNTSKIESELSSIRRDMNRYMNRNQAKRTETKHPDGTVEIKEGSKVTIIKQSK